MKKEKDKESVAIYCRVSSGMQSTDRQEKELLDMAEKLGFTIDDGYIFKDIVTGFSAGRERPQYAAMLKEIDEGNINVVLISELTRLGRNSVELLEEIEKLRNKGVELYFQKQNIWVRQSKTDLSTEILLHVLAITSSYEIDLLVQRSISGKITKALGGGSIGPNSEPYGYCIDENKKLIINEEEAEFVLKIFKMYANGTSVIEICEYLNREKIPTPMKPRIEGFKINRKRKGLKEKEYSYDDNMKWRTSTLSRMLCNELYIGHRHLEFKLDSYYSEDGNIQVVDKQFEHLRIISDELFQQVKDRLSRACYNKNNAIKHDNLLKPKLVCGDCGSNFSVGKTHETATNYNCKGRTYKCYGTVNRHDKPRTCKSGVELRMWKLDGLVLQLSLRHFAEHNIEEANTQKIQELRENLVESEHALAKEEESLVILREKHRKVLSRLMTIECDEIAQEMMVEEEEKYTKEFQDLSERVKKKRNQITKTTNLISQLTKLSKRLTSIQDKMNEIRQNKELVQTMVNEFIKNIKIYRIHKLWALVVVEYVTGAEMWGTIKTARYKKNEMFFDEGVCENGVEFQTWIINNTRNNFKYDKESQTITYDGQSSIYSVLEAGTYNYEHFHDVLKRNEWIGSYSLYDYESSQNENIPPTQSIRGQQQENSIDWSKHNKKIIERHKRNSKAD